MAKTPREYVTSESIAPDSIRHEVNSVIRDLKRIDLTADGYTVGIDDEIWNWIDKRSMFASQRQVGRCIERLLDIQSLLSDKILEQIKEEDSAYSASRGYGWQTVSFTEAR